MRPGSAGARRMVSDASLDVLGIGENSCDLVYRVARPVAPNSKQELLAERRLAGGQVATTLCTCAALGLRTKYVGAFGSDDAGRFVREAMSRHGVDLASAHTHQARNRRAIILVDESTGDRSILWQREASLELHVDLLDRVDVASAHVLHVDSTDAAVAVAAASLARQAGRIVTADVDDTDPLSVALLDAATHPIVAEAVPAALTGETNPARALQAMRRPHHAMLCVTLGARGSMLLAGDTVHHAPPPRIDPVDTTGAGDVFRGAFIHALLRGDAPPDILRFANAAAAASCLREGAIEGVPSIADITRLLSR